MAFLLIGRDQIIHDGFGEHPVFERYIDLWIHSTIRSLKLLCIYVRICRLFRS
jgi:hypothetical protein